MSKSAVIIYGLTKPDLVVPLIIRVSVAIAILERYQQKQLTAAASLAVDDL
ncbi:hypothetical protein [Okeania sp. SIO2B3]|uniref:hypothetical protein n=1 Tax=Okeania sp. SIO2B3 TaxID=2607784 RepID=UPI0013BFC59B|nr:hypothetical protein [Okeania sp. SIO2B3]NET46995.1 hypothetical protein [Okeania sp. SIO2B3]